jgi:hypothetical protein
LPYQWGSKLLGRQTHCVQPLHYHFEGERRLGLSETKTYPQFTKLKLQQWSFVGFSRRLDSLVSRRCIWALHLAYDQQLFSLWIASINACFRDGSIYRCCKKLISKWFRRIFMLFQQQFIFGWKRLLNEFKLTKTIKNLLNRHLYASN